MFRIAYRVLGHIEDAEEARQDTLVSLLANPNCWPLLQHHAAWVRRCTINSAISLYRRKSRRKATRLSDHTDEIEGSETADPHEVMDLRLALLQLDAETRALLSLRFDEGLTVREIGEAMGTAHTTIQSRLSRAIESLQSRLCSGEQHYA